MKNLLLLLLIPMIGFGKGKNVNIPDANFKAYLVGNKAINSNGDTEIQVSEASAFKGEIDCSELNISDLTGIEAFTALTSLYCYTNKLTSLDVSKNTALTKLSCQRNLLTSLDVSQNTVLTDLTCSTNQLTSLDVSKNTVLTDLICSTNQLTSLDVSKNTALTYLDCSTNQLTNLDVSKNTALTYLGCSTNQLTSLDVSKNTALTTLYCSDNQLTSLDVSLNTALNNVECEIKSKKPAEEQLPGQTYNSDSIIGTPIRIGKLEIAQYDFPSKVTGWKWDEAVKMCTDLGNGWRLPTKDEFYLLYQNKDKIGLSSSETIQSGGRYWSGSENGSGDAWHFEFARGVSFLYGKANGFDVRAVRSF